MGIIIDIALDVLGGIGVLIVGLILLLFGGVIIYNISTIVYPRARAHYLRMIQRLAEQNAGVQRQILEIQNGPGYLVLGVFDSIRSFLANLPIYLHFYFVLFLFQAATTTYNSGSIVNRVRSFMESVDVMVENHRRRIGINTSASETGSQFEEESSLSFVSSSDEENILTGVPINTSSSLVRVDHETARGIIRNGSASSIGTLSTITLTTVFSQIEKCGKDLGFKGDSYYSYLFFYSATEETARLFKMWVEDFLSGNLDKIPPHALKAIKSFKRVYDLVKRTYTVEDRNLIEKFYKSAKLDSKAHEILKNAAIVSQFSYELVDMEMPDTHIDSIVMGIICIALGVVIPILPIWYLLYAVIRYKLCGKVFQLGVCIVLTVLTVTYIKYIFVAAGVATYPRDISFMVLLFLTPVFGANVTFAASLGFFTMSFIQTDIDLAIVVASMVTIAFVGSLTVFASAYMYFFRELAEGFDNDPTTLAFRKNKVV